MESAAVSSLAERPQFIGGGWRPGTGDPFEVVKPARGQPLATLVGSTSEDVSAALSAARRSQNYSTIMRTVEDLQFGEIYINRRLGESVHAHHAGFKQSGIGGEDGKWGILRYTQIKTAYHHFGGSDQVTPSPDPIAEARTGRSEAR
jgi:acyl-CoA reductase-like NAD-dependent aldehyde dehydrogenase